MLVTQLLTGFGLAGSAGLNAYVPLLAISVLGRFGVITLKGPFEVLTHPAVIAVTVVLLLVELLVDKIPAVDHANDVIQTFIRPAAGALVFAAGSGAISDVPPVALLAAGLVIVFVGILANLNIYFRPTSLFNTLLMLALLAGGIGAMAAALRTTPAK